MKMTLDHVERAKRVARRNEPPEPSWMIGKLPDSATVIRLSTSADRAEDPARVLLYVLDGEEFWLRWEPVRHRET